MTRIAQVDVVEEKIMFTCESVDNAQQLDMFGYPLIREQPRGTFATSSLGNDTSLD